MELVHDYLILSMWLGFGIFWEALGRDVKASARREPLWSRLSHLVPMSIAVVLLFAQRMPVPVLQQRFLPLTNWPFWVGAAVTAPGLLFAIWARVHLGSNWSGRVTIKEGHELITSGPYALVRHPIYTGMLLAAVGSALACAEWRGILAVAVLTLSFWRKLRIEERWMRGQFGEAYQAYSLRVRALVPFVL